MLTHSGANIPYRLRMGLITARWGLAVCVVSLAACTQAPQTSDTVPTAEIVARIDSHCTDLNAPELGEGKLCIDNGFRVNADDFRFSNWGRSPQADANVTVQTLVDLFGQNNVCAPSAGNECVLRPSILQKLEQWNTALAAGRCEGLATLSTRFFMKLDHPSAFRDGATTVADLQRDDEALEAAIVYWWATQFLPEVSDRAAASRQRTPLDLVDDLIVGLANSVGYTVGMYFESSGHAVTPFAVTHRDDNLVIHVYDNNFPSQRREIFVNDTTNSWTYPKATQRIDGTWVDWTGGIGTLELTPMSARKGPFRCAFCITNTDNPTTITVSSRDSAAAGYVYLTSRMGTIDARPEGVVNSIEGATFTVSKGKTGGLVTVTLPTNLDEFDISIRRVSDIVPAGDVVVGVQRPGEGLVQVSGDLAHDTISSTKEAAPLMTIRQQQTTIRAPQKNSARVSVAAGDTISRRLLSAGESMSVTQASETSIEIALKGSNGYNFGKVPIQINPDGTTREITLLVNEDGTISTTNTSMLPVKIETSPLVNFTPGQAPTVTTTTTPRSTPSTVPTIEISEPD